LRNFILTAVDGCFIFTDEQKSIKYLVRQDIASQKNADLNADLSADLSAENADPIKKATKSGGF
jgi:hypothetical protein